MLSVGDLRNRIMALSEKNVLGNKDIYKLFAFRLSKEATKDELYNELLLMLKGKHPLIKTILNPMKRIIINHLSYFIDKMPYTFKLQGASIGNLILTGGYLNNHRHIEPVVFIFSKLVDTKGTVRPITGSSLHLAVLSSEGKTIIGEHYLSKKSGPMKDHKIEKIWLTKDLEKGIPFSIRIKPKTVSLIESSELIVYPFGSFYSSLIANLLPKGVGQAIAKSGCPKIFIPNPMHDQEQTGLSLYELVFTLLKYLKQDTGEEMENENLLNFILIDAENGQYQSPMNLSKIRSMGISIIDTKLITPQSFPNFDERLISNILLSLT
jgi:CofD-related protein of GAK system